MRQKKAYKDTLAKAKEQLDKNLIASKDKIKLEQQIAAWILRNKKKILQQYQLYLKGESDTFLENPKAFGMSQALYKKLSIADIERINALILELIMPK